MRRLHLVDAKGNPIFCNALRHKYKESRGRKPYAVHQCLTPKCGALLCTPCMKEAYRREGVKE